jgi:hypothetical protein
MNVYATLVTAHVLLLVFWLGTDVGVFVGSFRLRDPRLSVEARLAIGRVTSLLDMGPRTGVILAIPTGLTLAYAGGWGRRDMEILGPAVLAVVWIVCVAWLALVWRYFVIQQRAARGMSLASADVSFLRWWKRVDLWWRVALALAIAVVTIGAISGRSLLGAGWLDAKVGLFGFILACGVGIRIAADDLPLARDERRRHHQASTGGGIGNHTKDALAETQHVRHRRAAAAEKEDHFFAGRERRGADHDATVGTHFPAGYLERHRRPQAALQIRGDRDGDVAVDPPPPVRPLGAHVGDAAVDDRGGALHEIRQIRGENDGRARGGRAHDDDDRGERCATEDRTSQT